LLHKSIRNISRKSALDLSTLVYTTVMSSAVRRCMPHLGSKFMLGHGGVDNHGGRVSQQDDDGSRAMAMSISGKKEEEEEEEVSVVDS
jgi:hypothetical protein